MDQERIVGQEVKTKSEIDIGCAYDVVSSCDRVAS